MHRTVRFWGQLANKLLRQVGLQLIRTRPGYGPLDLYSEQYRPEPPRYINIGAGGFFHPFWHNLDTPNDFYARIQRGHLHFVYDLTLRQPLPFNDQSLLVAYTSHVIEHVSNEEAQCCFDEVYRCLRPGGIFRVTCPDIDLEYDAYLRGDQSFWPWPTPWGRGSVSLEQRFLEHFATASTLGHPDPTCRKFTDEEIRIVFSERPQEEALDYFIQQITADSRRRYPENHVNWYNANKLRYMLQRAGFEIIYTSGYGQSKCAMMRVLPLFDSTVPEMSLYMECQK